MIPTLTFTIGPSGDHQHPIRLELTDAHHVGGVSLWGSVELALTYVRTLIEIGTH